MAYSYLEREDIQAMLMVKAWQVWKRCHGWEEEDARRYTKQSIWRAASDIRAMIWRQARDPVQVDPPLDEVPGQEHRDTLRQYEAADALRSIRDALAPKEWQLLATAVLWSSQMPPVEERGGLSKGMWYYRVRQAREKISAFV